MNNTYQAEKSLVLIVDDDSFIRMQLRSCLEQQGYWVAEAQSGKEALMVCEELLPDIILLDAMMPTINGFDCCVQLRQRTCCQNTLILMMIESEDQSSVDLIFEVGATDYVTKPIRWAVLRHRVKRLIQQFQLQHGLEAANIELQRLATTDDLTQIANRRKFEEYLQFEWQRAAREQQPLSLIFCDIDFFKSYNDTYGHLAGDRCLQQVALAIKESVNRPTDLVARYGGEEFTVVLPNTNADGATQLAERVCAAVRALTISHPTSNICSYVTLSAGVATEFPQPGSDYKKLIAVADLALYQAKVEGRNRTRQSSRQCCYR